MWNGEKNCSLDYSMILKLKGLQKPVNEKILSLKETNTFAVDIKCGGIYGFDIFIELEKQGDAHFESVSLIKKHLPEYKLFDNLKSHENS